MSAWVANAVALTVAAAGVGFFALALLWRIGSWQIAPAAILTHDEGLRIGSGAPEVAAYGPGGEDYHLSFQGRTSFVMFGSGLCKPCAELLEAAAAHAATRHMRLVYISDGRDPDFDPNILARWEQYRFHDEDGARKQWRAPVSPYFHVVDPEGRVIEKGIANRPQHLDRLLSLRPAGIQPLRSIRSAPAKSPN